MANPLPRHMGLGALLKTVAESTELRTVDVKAVLDKLLAITLERCGKKLRIHMPPELLRAMRRKASPSGPWRLQLPPRPTWSETISRESIWYAFCKHWLPLLSQEQSVAISNLRWTEVQEGAQP